MMTGNISQNQTCIAIDLSQVYLTVDVYTLVYNMALIQKTVLPSLTWNTTSSTKLVNFKAHLYSWYSKETVEERDNVPQLKQEGSPTKRGDGAWWAEALLGCNIACSQILSLDGVTKPTNFDLLLIEFQHLLVIVFFSHTTLPVMIVTC